MLNKQISKHTITIIQLVSVIAYRGHVLQISSPMVVTHESIDSDKVLQ